MVKDAQISVIIPAYNEQSYITACLDTIFNQTLKPTEVIVIDDGSTDKTVQMVQSFPQVTLLRQSHLGTAKARNLGAFQAKGDILVFVDADMTFDNNFLLQLVAPIVESQGYVKGTWTKEELVGNWHKLWSRMWNLNQGLAAGRRIPADAPDKGTDFRAIVKDEFERVGGFDDIGYTDVYSLWRKLGYRPQNAPRAVCYHNNPQTLMEVWQQARWIGKNEFISGSLARRLWSLWRYGPVNSLLTAMKVAAWQKQPAFVVFKIIYDLAVWVSVIKSFLKESKAK